MSEGINTVEFTLDRGTEGVLLKIGYDVLRSIEDGYPMTVQIIWINPANIMSTLTEEEWDEMHAVIYREEQQHLKRGLTEVDTFRSMPRSELDELI